MANTHIAPSVKAKLLRYCEETGLQTPTQGIESLLSELSAFKRENIWLSKLVIMYEATEDKRMENTQ